MARWRQTLINSFDSEGWASPPIWMDESGTYMYSHSDFGWIISSTLSYSVSIDGSAAATDFRNVFGHNTYTSGSMKLWFNGADEGLAANQWCLSNGLGCKIKEAWVWNDPEDHASGGYYSGDEWYSNVNNPFAIRGTYMPRGSLRGTTLGGYDPGNTIDVVYNIGGYKRNEPGPDPPDPPAGEYQEFTFVGTVTGGTETPGPATVTVGALYWSDQNSKEYKKSPWLDANSNKHTYGDIYYDVDETTWVIGIVGAFTGWWEGSEPSKTTPVTFRFKKPSGSRITGTDLTITYLESRKELTAKSHLVFGAGRWLPQT